MTNKNDGGGPAYPSSNGLATAPGVVTGGHVGMTLRDYFAAKALQGVLSQMQGMAGGNDPNVFASDAYLIADAMLKARGES